MKIHIRQATAFDARSMAELLNEIIAIGGTTALTKPISSDALLDWLDLESPQTATHVATNDLEQCQGFQWIGPWEDLPEDACEIGSFVRVGLVGYGIGSKLFDVTRRAAKSIGYSWIRANIRSDNESGLTYYQSRGFENYDRRKGVTLEDGSIVDKTLKRFDLS